MTAPANIPALIAEGRRLIAAATPGPLEADEHGVVRAGPVRHYTRGSGRSQLLAVMMVELGDSDTAEAMLSRRIADTALFPFAVNNLAALLDVVEAAARNSWAREEYGLASGASHTEPGSICETCERTKDAAQAVLDSEDALDSALSKLRGVTT